MLKWIRISLSPILGTIFVAGITLGFSPCSWGGHYKNCFKIEKQFPDTWCDNSLRFARRNRILPSSEKRKMEKQYKEWQSLSPEEKKKLRLRMEQWKQMPPQQRNLYKKRHQQWQQIDPKERRQLEEKIYRWDRLSPEERDQIRMKFRK